MCLENGLSSRRGAKSAILPSETPPPSNFDALPKIARQFCKGHSFDECLANRSISIQTHVFVVYEKRLNLTFTSMGGSLSSDAAIYG